MAMNMKNGFSSLNRLLGKKSKSNTNLSDSSTKLSVSGSTTVIEDSSQMHQNRITPLPVATSNVPFEQTFRITVLLPKDQLYVARLGAKVRLQKLLQLVCENKQLDADKYEFRHPANPSQIFSCDLTIGAVGLSELRLCNKSESYATFNADEIIKLHRTAAGRDSASSSEFSSKNSKLTIKTPSPYSSSNSLNSMDSTGLSLNYRHSTPKVVVHSEPPPVAPTRKKRLAPRPPSQNSIPEIVVPQPIQSVEIPVPNNKHDLKPLPRKEFHVSSPNLSQTLELSALDKNDFHRSNLSIDCNGNTKGSLNNNNNNDKYYQQSNKGVDLQSPLSIQVLKQTTESPTNLNGDTDFKNVHNSYRSVQNLSSIEGAPNLPEPSPRKRITIKSKKSAPAPPPRSLQNPSETIEESLPEDELPVPPVVVQTLQVSPPKALPRTTVGRLTPEPTEHVVVNPQNVSKTMLNRSRTPEPLALPSQNTEDTTSTPDNSFDSESKQADSGIGETLDPSPLPLSAQNSPTQCKVPSESSSDDDEMIKVYNLKLGKTIMKTLSDHKALEDLTVLSNDDSDLTDQSRTPAETCSVKSEATSWSNFTIPAPPTFADTSEGVTLPDTPITPIIKERPALDFTLLTDVEQTAVSLEESPVAHVIKTASKTKQSNSDIEDGFKGNQEEHEITKLITEVNAIIRDEKEQRTTNQVEKENAILKGKEELQSIKQIEKENAIVKDKEELQSTKQIEKENVVVNDKEGLHNTKQIVEVKAAIKNEEDHLSIKLIAEEKAAIEEQENHLSTKQFTEVKAVIKDEENHPSTKHIVEVRSFIRDEEDLSTKQITEDKVVMKDVEEPPQKHEIELKQTKDEIQPKSNEIIDLSELGEQEAQAINEMDTIINSIDCILNQKPLISTLERLGIDSEVEEQLQNLQETKIYKKRISHSNIFKQRNNSITRSDSFHSTRQQQIEETTTETNKDVGLTTRSSSFASLAKFGFEQQQIPPAEDNLKRRRSSSELSIGESPSLQSVEVMKSILNSRKNSLTSQSSTEEQKSPPIVSDIIQSLNRTPAKDKVLATNNINKEKIYRYSGPPSINFSTWSERPKHNVAIKNEGDYIFGGRTNGNGHNATTTATVNLVQQKNYRNSTPEATLNRLPFVRSVEYKKPAARPILGSVVEDKKNDSIINDVAKSPQSSLPSPAIMPKPKFILGGRMSNPMPVVKGFSQSTTNNSAQSLTNNSPINSLLRSTSVSKADVKPKPEPTQPMFGQGTLRKTGLKEKILAQNDNDQNSTPNKTPEVAKVELRITKAPPLMHKNSISFDRSSVHTAPVAPPPPPIIRGVVTKQNSNGSLTSTSKEPRDELLSAIRNFKRDDLKRA